MGTFIIDMRKAQKNILRIFIGNGVQAAAEFDSHQREGHFEGITVYSRDGGRPGHTFMGTREQLFSVLYAIESCPLFFGDCGNELETLSAKSACRRTAARVRRELKLGPNEKYPEPSW